MRSSIRSRAMALCLGAVALILVGQRDSAAEEPRPGGERLAAEEPSPRVDCCFTNISYVGVCRVEPAEDETCATILAYLNDPQTRGKTYCGSTTIRGGWKEVACEAPNTEGPVESP